MNISGILFLLLGTLWSVVSSDEVIAHFLNWFKANGGITNGLDLGIFPEMGRGVLASRDITSGQEVLFIPTSLIFSALSAQNSEDEIHRKLGKIFANHEELIGALILLEKCRGNSSFWKPYLDVLPNYVPNLNTYSKAELAELQDSSFADEVAQGWQRVASQIRHFKQKASLIWPCDIELVSMDDYLWASSIVDSRAFRFQGAVNLAPFSEMFNYFPHSEPRRYNAGNFFLNHHRLSKAGLQVLADRDCPAGEQLLEDYGDNTDRIYLQYHGFVADNNPFRCVHVSPPDKENITNEQTRKLLDALQFTQTPAKCVDASGNLAQSMEIYFATMALSSDEISDCSDVISNSNKNWKLVLDMCGFSRVSKELRAFLDAANAREPTAQCGKSKLNLDDMDTNTLTYKTIQQIQNVLRAKAKEYPTTIRQDKSLLDDLNEKLRLLTSAGEKVSQKTSSGALLRKINAVRYRYFAKKHLSDLCWLYGAADCFGTGHYVNDRNACPEEEVDSDDEEVSGEKITLRDEWSRSNRHNDAVLKKNLMKFNKWFNSLVKPPAVNHLKADLIPGFRVGTVATKNLSREELYLAVPNEAIIDTYKADRDYHFSKLLFDLERRFFRRDDFHELMLYLIYQCFVKGSESKYWPYLRLLPSPAEMDRPLFWSREQVDSRLGPSFVKESIYRYQESVAAIYQGISKVDMIGVYIPRQFFTQDIYVWATSILDSRSIWWGGVRHLVPMLDFVNCLERASDEGELLRVHATKYDRVPNAGHLETPNVDPRHALTYAAWDFKEGEQVVENYGQPSHTYLIHHGFFIESSAYDCVHFTLSVTPEERAQIDWTRAQSLVQKLNLRRRKEDGDNVPSYSFCLEASMKWSELPLNAWLYLSLKSNLLEGSLDDISNTSPQLRQLLLTLVTQQRDLYNAFIPTDHDMSNRFVRNEKRILDSWINSVAGSIGEFHPEL